MFSRNRRPEPVDQLPVQSRAFNQAAAHAADATRQGDFSFRIDAEDFDGELAEAAESVNAAFAAMQARSEWHEAILDALPFALSVTDMDMNWTFINRTAEQMRKVTRQSIMGAHCSNFNASICNTADCGIVKLRAQVPRTTFQSGNEHFQVDTSYLVDPRGEKLGHIEVIQDITALRRSSEYQASEAERLAGTLGLLAEGDLDVHFAASAGDEHCGEARAVFEKITQYLEGTVVSLRDTIGQVQDNVRRLTDASEQMKVASEESARATQQAAETVQQVAADAMQSRQASEDVATTVRSGQQTVEQTILAMRTIEETVSTAGSTIAEMQTNSSKIGEIVETIDDIAEQTNLLALNAAIEAARAGEHGRGFAVVADEVRKLAERSQRETKAISELIRGVQKGIGQAASAMEASLKQVGDGVQLADDAGAVLLTIADGSSAANDTATRIARSASSVAAMSEEMSAQMEEFSAMSQTLGDMADSLSALIGYFRLGHDAGARGALGEPRRRSVPLTLLA